MIALLPWGDVIEDFLDAIGVSLEDFSSKMTGGWLFGYIEALRLQGVRSTIFCFSDRVKDTVRKVHKGTGAEIVVLRAPAIYRGVRRHINDPYGWSVEAMFGPAHGLSYQFRRVARHVVPYLATSVMGLAREVRRAGCCAIICQEYEAPRFDASVLIGRLLRIPVFATYQGGNWQRSRIERSLRSVTIGRCAGLIIGSASEAARVRNRYGIPAQKIATIFNPLDLSEWRLGSRQEARQNLGIRGTTRVAVWHGRVDIQIKGLDVLLEAWKAVCSSRSEQDLLLMVVGTGSDADTFDNAIRRMAVPNVRWIRNYVLDRAKMRQYLNASDVYVFPSRREGFPVAPLEAMACGLPVVAARAPGVVDIFGDGEEYGGITVPIGDAGSLASNLGRLLDDAASAHLLGTRARERVEHAFSLNTVGTQLHELLQSSGAWGPKSVR